MDTRVLLRYTPTRLPSRQSLVYPVLSSSPRLCDVFCYIYAPETRCCRTLILCLRTRCTLSVLSSYVVLVG
ncbi:hypothetical protein BD310DRAFT_935671 [Dichomitus squalens]|uniref:Uncharacterized protein n=1 Tax=Dichomitus squalens TaxID=114155 RepID=A0A4Q9PKA6_9APHY|nr:hypothetical protein BD310DRAFT_935671 [Dichomitus squalens]